MSMTFDGAKWINNDDMVIEDDQFYTLDHESGFRVLAKGIYGFRHWMIGCTHGNCPVAYVELCGGEYESVKDEDGHEEYQCTNEPTVHGGVTYCNRYPERFDTNEVYVGWDYSHCDDYCPNIYSRHIWKDTTQYNLFDVIMDVGHAIGEMDNNVSAEIADQMEKNWKKPEE